MNTEEYLKQVQKDYEKRMIKLYLDYVNNFLTVSTFAQWHGLTNIQAQNVIKEGSYLNEREVV